MYQDIRYEVIGAAGVITLSRPESMNAMTPTMEVEIRDALERAAADRTVVGIVITGDGRAFCAGADMKNLTAIAAGDTGSAEDPRADDDRTEPGEFTGRFPYLMTIDKPIIAAINGAVAGMAFPFVLCCDLRVITPEAVLLTAFSQRGLIAEWGLSWVLPRLVGPGVALDLLFSSRKVGGVEAKALGLVNECVERDQLLPWCLDYIERLAAACSPTSMAIMKRQVYQQLHAGLGDAERESVRLMVESFGRPDFGEGVQSFLEKRPPSFARLPLDG